MIYLAHGCKAEKDQDGDWKVTADGGWTCYLSPKDIAAMSVGVPVAESPAIGNIEITWRDITVSIKGGGV